MAGLAILLAACGGSVPVNIPEGAVLEFTAAGLDGRPPIDCIGRIYMSVRSAQFTCHDSRQTPPTTEVVDATVDYIQRHQHPGLIGQDERGPVRAQAIQQRRPDPALVADLCGERGRKKHGR